MVRADFAASVLALALHAYGVAALICPSELYGTCTNANTRTLTKYAVSGTSCVPTNTTVPCPTTLVSACTITWGAWSACNAATGMKTRTRVVPEGSSSLCPTSETDVCDPVACVLKTDSEAASDPWGACQLNSAGAWTRTKVRQVKTAALYGGACASEGDATRKIVEACPAANCELQTVVDAKADASGWDPCMDDGTGVWKRRKLRTIITAAKYGGTCTEDRVVEETCAATDCSLQDTAAAKSDTSGWTPCSKSGDKWVQTKLRGIVEAEKYGGVCTDAMRTVTKDCVAKDCVLEDYSSASDSETGWEPCMNDGTGWKQSKLLAVDSAAEYGGTCDASRRIYRTCPAEDCVLELASAASSKTTGWDPCVFDSDGWYQHRLREVLVGAKYGGICPTDAQRTVKKACPAADCVLETEAVALADTSGWDPCRKVGSDWVQTKLRKILTAEMYGGVCTEDRLVTKACAAENCELDLTAETVTTGWDPCVADGAGWTQSKLRAITTPAKNGGTCTGERVVTKSCAQVNCDLETSAAALARISAVDSCVLDSDGWNYHKLRTLNKAEENGGTCLAEASRVAKKRCAAVNCVVNTPSEDTGSFGVCEGSINWSAKFKSKVLGIKTPAMYGGTPCPVAADRTTTDKCTISEWLSSIKDAALSVSGGTAQLDGTKYVLSGSLKGSTGGGYFGFLEPYNPALKRISFSGGANCTIGTSTFKRSMEVALACGASASLDEPVPVTGTCSHRTILRLPAKELCA